MKKRVLFCANPDVFEGDSAFTAVKSRTSKKVLDLILSQYAKRYPAYRFWWGDPA